jgi:polysaccharide biosynthesis protein PslG
MSLKQVSLTFALVATIATAMLVLLSSISLPVMFGKSGDSIATLDFNKKSEIASTATRTEQHSTVYLPVLTNGTVHLAKLGADVGYLTLEPDIVDQDYAVFQQIGADWVRVWLGWGDIETSPGVYDWSEYDNLFARLDALGMETIGVLYYPPDWVYNSESSVKGCGPIDDTDKLTDFLNQIIPRYRQYVSAWEFINEPDGSQPHVYGPFIGCWGNHPVEYTKQLEIFHQQVRKLDPAAPVFFGGLAYDGWGHFVRDFFAATLENGAGDYFDGVSLHFYPINPVDFPDISYKIKEIQSIMAEYGVTSKQIWITETSMWVNQDGSLAAQRNYIVKEFSRAYCNGVDNIMWYAMRQEPGEPFLHRWLVNIDHEPDNAHDTFSTYAELLKGAVCEGMVEEAAELMEIYRFVRGAETIYTAWSNAAEQPVKIPATSEVRVIDWTGKTLQVLVPEEGAVEIKVGTQPFFIVTR